MARGQKDDVGISIHALREEGDQDYKITSTNSRNFYPRPPRGGRPQWSEAHSDDPEFLSTPSARRATGLKNDVVRRKSISIHALREEGDLVSWAVERDKSQISIHALREEGDQGHPRRKRDAGYFYPRPPRGGRLAWPSTRHSTSRFLSTPSARRATLPAHARAQGPTNFYPRPPRGGRPFASYSLSNNNAFLSTPSARRATGPKKPRSARTLFLSTPSARRATKIPRKTI